MKIISKRENGNLSVKTMFPSETKTQQQFKEMCDINNIMSKYEKTRQFSHVNLKQGAYLDNTTAKSYEESLQTVISANNHFNTLPAELRKRLNNDPAQFLEWIHNPKNIDEAQTYGLLTKKQIEQKNEIKNENTNDIKS